MAGKVHNQMVVVHGERLEQLVTKWLKALASESLEWLVIEWLERMATKFSCRCGHGCRRVMWLIQKLNKVTKGL
jgi:hypothetical protein